MSDDDILNRILSAFKIAEDAGLDVQAEIPPIMQRFAEQKSYLLDNWREEMERLIAEWREFVAILDAIDIDAVFEEDHPKSINWLQEGF